MLGVIRPHAAGRWKALDAKLEQRIARLETKLKGQKAEIIKWMFAFWAPTAIGVVSLLLRG